MFVLSLSASVNAQQTFNDITVRNWLRLEPNPVTGSSFKLESNGSLLSILPFGSFGQSLLGSGSFPEGMLMLWDPGKLAFRASYVHPTFQIGEGSAAFGWAVADGQYSFAAVGGMAAGDGSTAFGVGYAVGYMSFAVGDMTYANGYWSLAGGFYSQADGDYSMAVGYGAVSHGSASLAGGDQTLAGAYASMAIGRFNGGNYFVSNDGDASNDGDKVWIDTDPVFEVGNGTPATAQTGWQPVRSNALTVFKNGNVTVGGVITVGGGIRVLQPAGDLSMGEFTASPP